MTNRVYIFIKQNALASLPTDQIDLKSFSISLVSGDAKNDRLCRELIATTVGRDENSLVQAISDDTALDSDCHVYVVGFSYFPARQLATEKARRNFKLYVVNAPFQKHPAALTAIADATKRVRKYHLAAATGVHSCTELPSLHAGQWRSVVLT